VWSLLSYFWVHCFSVLIPLVAFKSDFWSLIRPLRDSSLLSFQPLMCAKVFLKFSEGIVLTNPSLLVCSGLDAMSGFSWWKWWPGILASPSSLWCGADAWVFYFFLADFVSEL
jgi:hypothetical protein